jgi:hypothetical protein
MHVCRGVVASLLLLTASSCATYRDQLGRAQHAFEDNDHDRTLAILRNLEPDVRRLSMPEQAEYAYLRGMTDYRVGYKPDARHWLSISKAYEDHSPGVLPADWKTRINEALEDLDNTVYTAGTSALTTTRVDDSDARDAKKREPNGKAEKVTKKEPASDTKKGADPRDVSPQAPMPSDSAAQPAPARK